MRGCGADWKTEKEKKEIKIAPETQKLNWYVIDLPTLMASIPDVDWRARRRPGTLGVANGMVPG
jgi:hypothetical protein